MKFSIVIPNYNGAGLLAANLPQVLQMAAGNQVVVVDDASTDNSLQILKQKFPQVMVVKHKVNQRFAKAVNSGVRAAAGEVIILLNSDLIPLSISLTDLAKKFDDPELFALGFLETSTQGKRGKSSGKFIRGLLQHAPASDLHAGNTFWAFGGSAAFNRQKWLELEGMDSLYAPAYWEDIDLSYRAQKRGWKVLFDPRFIVRHEPETTNLSVFGRQKMIKMSSRNQVLFIWKNIHSPRLVLGHLLWFLPTLIQLLIRRKTDILSGFLSAFPLLPQALLARSKEKKLARISDLEVLKKFR